MPTESQSTTNKVLTKVVKLDKAFKLAESWVKNMSGGTATDIMTGIETEGRQPRLGLGARITPNAQRTSPTDPTERKLLGRVNAKRKQNSEDEEKVNTTEKNMLENCDDDTDEPESRTAAVAKKRPVPLPAASQVKRQK